MDILEGWVDEVRPAFSPGRLAALFVTERSSRMALRGPNTAFEQARDTAGLPTELDLHALRHSYVTHLVEFDYPEKLVSLQVGHSYASTTAIYTGVCDEYRNRLVQRAFRDHRGDLDRIPAWLDQLLADYPHHHARLIRPFVHWFPLKRARRRATERKRPAMAATSVRTRTRVALELLTWLDSHDLTLARAHPGPPRSMVGTRQHPHLHRPLLPRLGGIPKSCPQADRPDHRASVSSPNP